MKNKISNLVIGFFASFIIMTGFVLFQEFSNIKIDPFFIGWTCGCVFVYIGFDKH